MGLDNVKKIRLPKARNSKKREYPERGRVIMLAQKDDIRQECYNDAIIRSLFAQEVTTEEFHQAMKFANDEISLKDVLSDYPDYEGELLFDDD
ncbi:MAG: hypothetical protein LBS21_13850 [Clostridiales bacterium]|jgi:hypothetical protein|nr:hypothetical protein [Clostridiales bacterium]